MELQIPPSFKVQWLNTTLKFIKDDTQLVKDYQQMPYSHVEYLHNLIWQRKNNVGLGFKSLYSPVWEAMKIYSVKYQFKIFVEKSEDGMSGHLIMQKIPKTGQSAKNLNDEKMERENETIPNSEVPKKTETEAVKCKQPDPQKLKKAKTKKQPMSKSLKMFMENQNILDSLSPLFIKNMLNSILDFLTDKLSASKIFTDLAPIESRFLENFLSIFARKNDLEVMLSPACNEILTEISNCLNDFSETCSLDITCVGVNSNTNKREVRYTKVPVFPNKKKAKPKLNDNSIQTKTKTISPNDDTTQVVNISSINKVECNKMTEENISKETKKRQFKNQTLQNNAISEDIYAISQPIDQVIETIDKNVVEALSTFVKKPNVKPKTTTYLKDTGVNKSEPLPKITISLTNEGSKRTVDIPSTRKEQKSPKIKIEQDMTVPVNGDKTASPNSEATKHSQTEPMICKQPKPQPLNEAKPKKPSPQMSNGLKMFIENQNILDSLSHLFIKTKLKSILDFLTDESTIKIFTDLAPIESRFLENFLSIYERRNDLEVMLSPACNEILTEISNCFDDFGKTCSLDISCVGVNSNANKREVKYTKVPVVPSKKKAKPKLKETNNIPSNDNTTKLVNIPSHKEEYKMTTKENISKATKNIKSQNKTLQNNGFSEDIYAKSDPIDKVIKTKDNNVVENLSTFVKKPNDVKPKTTTYLKDTSFNKSVLLPKKSINFTKEGTSSTDTPYIKVEKKSPNMKILRDMTVPLNSDKGSRMMQLMGWQGGALGLRGDGITEPIIPIPNFKNCGLGHVTVKKDPIKETRNYIRSEFMNKILKMIDNNIKVSVIKLQNQLNKRENRFLKLTIKLMNDRVNLDAEFEKRLEVKDKMVKNKDIIFNIDLEDENRKIIITKTSKKEMKVNNTSKDTNAEENDTKNKTSEATFKTIVLKSILELLNSEDKEKVIQFDKDLKVKHIRYSNIIILLINERQYVKQKDCRVVAELGSKVLEAIGDIVLSVSIYENERYIVIRKTHPKSNVNKKNIKTVVKKAESDENNKSAFDDVRSYLPIQKKYKLLNALYKYEVDFTEDFKENQWYNTVDKSLLESEIVKQKKQIMRILQ